MNIRYQIKDIDDIVAVTIAKCQLPMFGCWTDLTITTYSVMGGTAINFLCKPLNETLRTDDWFHATTKDRPFRVNRKTPDCQLVLQHITFKPIQGIILYWTELKDGGVEVGRTLARAIMEKSESIIETVRQSIRSYISNEVQQLVLTELHRRYHQITAKVMEQLLREINWPLMLRQAECDDDTMNVLVASLDGRNAAGYDTFPITFDGDTGIETISNEIVLGVSGQSGELEYQIGQLIRDAKQVKSNLSATALLRNVCGDVLGDEFDKTGSITFSKNGYTFKMAPGGFLDCWDPNRKFARLCIHTVGFACNAIDEIVLAYLNIQNKFKQYMATAVYHQMSKDFQKPHSRKY